ncbi:hypothetical protein ElyMa_003836200 [Elysia marginata]|uniref:Uncharacterized protein n=1 Tax=Elysia marginata TaxID=1093978 RepID=A0AAV4FG38_9GAST|nr:hypothetical protein ElyMa_003836200 [Elysia marginata]
MVQLKEVIWRRDTLDRDGWRVYVEAYFQQWRKTDWEISIYMSTTRKTKMLRKTQKTSLISLKKFDFACRNSSSSLNGTMKATLFVLLFLVLATALALEPCIYDQSQCGSHRAVLSPTGQVVCCAAASRTPNWHGGYCFC